MAIYKIGYKILVPNLWDQFIKDEKYIAENAVTPELRCTFPLRVDAALHWHTDVKMVSLRNILAHHSHF